MKTRDTDVNHFAAPQKAANQNQDAQTLHDEGLHASQNTFHASHTPQQPIAALPLRSTLHPASPSRSESKGSLYEGTAARKALTQSQNGKTQVRRNSVLTPLRRGRRNRRKIGYSDAGILLFICGSHILL